MAARTGRPRRHQDQRGHATPPPELGGHATTANREGMQLEGHEQYITIFTKKKFFFVCVSWLSYISLLLLNSDSLKSLNISENSVMLIIYRLIYKSEKYQKII